MARHFDLQSWLISKIWQDLVTLSARNPGQAAVRWRFAHCAQKQKKCSKIRKLLEHYSGFIDLKKPVFAAKNSSKPENLTRISHAFGEKSQSSRCALAMCTLCTETEKVFENSENFLTTQVPLIWKSNFWPPKLTDSYRKISHAFGERSRSSHCAGAICTL